MKQNNLACSSTVQSQKAVTAYLSSEQLLPFDFAEELLSLIRMQPVKVSEWILEHPLPARACI